MTAATFVLAVLLASAQDQPPNSPPLTEEQRARLSRVANGAQQDAARFKSLLKDREQELAQVYALYDLDEQRATKLEAEILELQRQMLDSHRKLQVDLRAVVGKERF